ncbi:hypothetical protein [Streptomyces malaysiense]|nr:hypothetical protein [Streptomyces malaysiense]
MSHHRWGATMRLRGPLPRAAGAAARAGGTGSGDRGRAQPDCRAGCR